MSGVAQGLPSAKRVRYGLTGTGLSALPAVRGRGHSDGYRRDAFAQDEDELVVAARLATGEVDHLEHDALLAAHRTEIVEKRVGAPHVEVNAVIEIEEEPYSLLQITFFKVPPRHVTLDVFDPVDKVVAT